MVISNERPKERNSIIKGLRAKFGMMPPPIRGGIGGDIGTSGKAPVISQGPFIPKKRVIENVIPDNTFKINKPNVEYRSAIYKNPLM